MHYEQALLKSMLNRGYIDEELYIKVFDLVEREYGKKEREEESKKDKQGEVQEYKDTSRMTREELIEYYSKPYKNKYGTIVECEYNENGESFSVLFNRYFEKILQMKG